jgi:excinuclease ABC subunit C
MDFDLKDFLKKIPTGPGVYLMLGRERQILYVGKAKNLKKRVSSYFREKSFREKSFSEESIREESLREKKHKNPSFQESQHSVKTQTLVEKIKEISVTLTQTETEALLLEQTLIKKHRPPYNISLKDDKSYPYLVITEKHPFPRLTFRRGVKPHEGKVFGPFVSAQSVHESYTWLQKVFKVRTCDDYYFSHRSRPCLQYQIRRCSAPCVGFISMDAYRHQIQQIEWVLQGKPHQVIAQLKEEMLKASQALEFEQAVVFRDQLQALASVRARQFVSGLEGSADVFAISTAVTQASIVLLKVMDGKVTETRTFFISITPYLTEPEILEGFLSQYYFADFFSDILPEAIVLPFLLPNQKLLADAFESEKKMKLQWCIAKQGKKRGWLKIAQLNAKAQLELKQAQSATMAARLELLSEPFQLNIPISRIECFDISHTQGSETIGSCVVFGQNGAEKSHYRRFKVADIQAGDDYAALKQVLSRRYQRALKEDISQLPEVVIIDGGKGQLKVAQEVFLLFSWQPKLLLSIAKGLGRKPGLETIYWSTPEEIKEVVLKPEAFILLQQVRDEAHRFALLGHRKRREKKQTFSFLNEIVGLGPKRRTALIRQFGSLAKIQTASVLELMEVKGIHRELAEKIYMQIQNRAIE